MKTYKYESGFSHEGKMVPDAEDGAEFYLASDVAALESAAVASALRVRELEQALQEIRNEAGSHTVNLKLKAQPGAGHVYIYDIANRALTETATK
jgi:hypothetical protein